MKGEPMSSIRSDVRGFSMLEIMVVVTLIGITAATVIPSVARRTRPFDMAAEARQIHTEISRLRAKSIAEQREYEVVVDGGSTVAIRHAAERSLGAQGLEGDATDDAGRVTDRTSDFASYATVEFNGEEDGTVTFYPTGRVNGTGDLVITDGSRRVIVRILASGMTRMHVETAGAAGP
jgi:prepilin-type N-terminal cleavage/methylation domain-containing protein